MEWCRCEQRPPLPDSDLCFLCVKEKSESPQVGAQEAPIQVEENPLRSLCALVYSLLLTCLAFVLGIGIFLGWAIRDALR
jgi:hypothetical protein